MADNPITTPLPADLPTDWVYGQTIGPQGTDVGLTQQHGYNYLMQQVNAAQQAATQIGQAFSGLPSLGSDGKIPASQLPAMNYDPAGSAAAVQKNLDAHTGNRSNPHGVTASQVGARADTWVPSWGEVSGKPGTFPPSGHNHDASQIVSGILPVSRGGTGVTSLAELAKQIGAITTAGGSLSGPLNFANSTWNKVGDDAAIGDHNIPGHLCIKGLNGAPGIRLYSQDESKSYQVYGEHNVTSGTGDIGAGAGLASGSIYLCYE